MPRCMRNAVERNQRSDTRRIDAFNLPHIQRDRLLAHNRLQFVQKTMLLPANQFVQIARNGNRPFNNGLMIACHT